MYCAFCGKQIADDAVFCPYCGKPTPQGDVLAELVAAARIGDQDAVSTLYEKTYSKVYYTVKSMIKDEDAVFDIVQDTYIKAFAHLDGFRGDAKFLPWVRQIAANTARDWLKKKRPMLFTELGSGDGQDTPVEELFPDERSENLPDQVIDQRETRRLIREIIEELPEDQRAAIGMFYYEEMSVKEIAAAMGVSESAVKSRLMYGRSKIEKKVRELEKQGTKLYSLSPLPFLLLLFRNQNAYAAEAPDSRILHAILASQPMDTAAAAGAAQGAGTAGTSARAGAAQGTGTAGTAAGAEAAGTVGVGAGAAAGGLGALKIGLIALAAVAVVGLGAFGAAQIASNFAESPEESIIEDIIDPEESEKSEAPEESATSEDSDASEETETPEESDPIDEALEQYRIIISQADSYDYDDETYSQWIQSFSYQYALVQVQPDDPVPTLLLAKVEEGLGAFIRFFQYDPDTKNICQPAETIEWGARTSFGMAEDGDGILYGYWFGTGEGTYERITLDGDSLIKETCWTGQVYDEDSGHPSSIAFDWHGIEDLSALDSWTAHDSNDY